jgi:uncharacterized protein YxeA
MAGAKETPRQKLISLMYLVFITMLALNVSKEVLDGFGQMFVKIADANERVSESNNLLLENIAVNATEKGGKWIGHKRTATKSKKSQMLFSMKLKKSKQQLQRNKKKKILSLLSILKWTKGKHWM